MDNSDDALDFFAPVAVYKTAQRHSALCMATNNVMLAGTRNGGIVGYQLNNNFTPASIIIEFNQICRGAVTRIVCLADFYNLLLLSDGNLYYYNVNKKKVKELQKGVSWFEVQRNGLRANLFFATKNKIFRADLIEFYDSSKDKKDLQSFKEYPFDSQIRSCAMLGDSILVELVSKDVRILSLSTQKEHASSLPKSEDLTVHALESQEFLALIRFDSKKYLSIFLDETGSGAKARNTISVNTLAKISNVASSRNFLAISAGTAVHIFNLRDCQFIQQLSLPEQNAETEFQFVDDNLFAITETQVFMFRKPKLERLYEMAMGKLNFKVGVSLLRLMAEDEPLAAKEFIQKLYSSCGWKLLEKNQHSDAAECFSNIPFDPVELIDLNMPEYNINRPSFQKGYPQQLKNFLRIVLRKRREELLKRLDRNIIRPSEIARQNRSEEDARVDQWLQVIDYAFIRVSIELKTYHELFEFLRTSSKVYSDNRNGAITALFKGLNEGVIPDPTELAIQAELNVVIRDFSAALRNLQDLYHLEKDKARFDFRTYAKSRALDILLSIQFDDSFQSILSEHFPWLTSEAEGVVTFFKKLKPSEKTTAKLLECVEKMDDDNANKYVIKNAFLSNMVEGQSGTPPTVNNEYFLTIMEIFKRTNDVKVLRQAVDFLGSEGRQFNWDILRRKYEKLSKEYQAVRPRDLYVFGELFFMQTFIMRKINDIEIHREAIRLMIDRKELSAVEDYCAGSGRYASSSPTADTGVERAYLLNELLDLYLEYSKYGEEKETYLQMINGLLVKFAGNPNLNPTQVILKMQDDVLVGQFSIDIFKFVESTLTELNAQEKEIMFQKNVSEAYLNKLENDLWKCKKRWVKIEDDSYCSKCGVRLLNRVFDVYPNGVVIDHNCYLNLPDADRCPLTAQNFGKTNPA